MFMFCKLEIMFFKELLMFLRMQKTYRDKSFFEIQFSFKKLVIWKCIFKRTAHVLKNAKYSGRKYF